MKRVALWVPKRGLCGERGVLVEDAAALLRLGCRPFFPYLIERIDTAIDHRRAARPA